MKIIKIYSLFVYFFIIQGCSVYKYEQERKYIGEIDNRKLELFFNDSDSGFLVFIETKDTINFEYSITKDYIQTLKKDDIRKKKTTIYKYKLLFSEEDENQFKELASLKELYKLKKRDNFSIGGLGNFLEVSKPE